MSRQFNTGTVSGQGVMGLIMAKMAKVAKPLLATYATIIPMLIRLWFEN